jgi:hypothetical protein
MRMPVVRTSVVGRTASQAGRLDIEATTSVLICISATVAAAGAPFLESQQPLLWPQSAQMSAAVTSSFLSTERAHASLELNATAPLALATSTIKLSTKRIVFVFIFTKAAC